MVTRTPRAAWVLSLLVSGCALASEAPADAQSDPCGEEGQSCCEGSVGEGLCVAPWVCSAGRLCEARFDAGGGPFADDAPPVPVDASVREGGFAGDVSAGRDAAHDDGLQGLCPGPRTICDGVCLDVRVDARHCGACGRRCAVAQECAAGRCVACGGMGQPTCAAGGCLAGLVGCDGVCLDTRSDGRHCGGCGMACEAGAACQAGVCRTSAGLSLTGSGGFARGSDGSLRGWGVNSQGQVADGTTTQRLRPSATQLSATAEQIAGGTSHGCARLADGTVQCWGLNSVGQLGSGAVSTTARLVPGAVPGLSGVRSIAVGSGHSCAVRGDGSVVCWGANNSRQLGTGDTSNRMTPEPVTGLSGEFVAVSAGLSHTCALRMDGAVFCWGLNTSGQLGNGGTSSAGPVAVTGVLAVELSAGYLNTCVRLVDGAVRCWGQNSYGQVGDGTTTVRTTPTAVRLAGAAAQVRVGAAFACARLVSGRVQCWGYNSNGGVGDGTTSTQRPVPVDVMGIADAIDLSNGGGGHTCARTAGGAVQCWGFNRSGQIGDGSTTNRPAPVTLTGL